MREIPLNHGMVALVSNRDYKWLMQWKWMIKKGNRTNYACRNTPKEKPTQVLMHRQIMGITDSKIEVDHKDRNGLNNRRGNLRLASKAEQQANSPKQNRKGSKSKYRGVGWNPRLSRWHATLIVGGKTKYLGSFKTEKEAAETYDRARKAQWKKFACPNF